jgi:integrase
MGIYRPKGQKVYIMDFQFHGERVRESTGMSTKVKAQQVYDNRKNGLKEGTAGIRKQKQPHFLSGAAELWQQAKKDKGKWSPSMVSIVEYSLGHLLPVFEKILLVGIEASDVKSYQDGRLAEGASNRTINIEIGVLRSIMKKYNAWARIAGDVGMLKDRENVGVALTPEQENLLLVECGRSVCRGLLPFVVVALSTGARYSTIRNLQWRDVDFANRSLKFGIDKTDAGSFRKIPLNQRAVEYLKMWASEFPDRQPAHFVFPSEKYGLHGSEGTFGGTVKVYAYDPDKAVSTIQHAWESTRKRTQRHCPVCDGTLVDREKPATGFICDACQFVTPTLPGALSRLRFHDLRHSAITNLIRARVPLPIIAKIVGWSPSTTVKMATRYGHFSVEDLREDVESMGTRETPEIGSPRFPPRFKDGEKPNIN